MHITVCGFFLFLLALCFMVLQYAPDQHSSLILGIWCCSSSVPSNNLWKALHSLYYEVLRCHFYYGCYALQFEKNFKVTWEIWKKVVAIDFSQIYRLMLVMQNYDNFMQRLTNQNLVFERRITTANIARDANMLFVGSLQMYWTLFSSHCSSFSCSPALLLCMQNFTVSSPWRLLSSSHMREFISLFCTECPLL